MRLRSPPVPMTVRPPHEERPRGLRADGDRPMPETWQIRVYDQLQSVYSGEVSGRVELGRQEAPSERLYSKRYLDRRRIVAKDGQILEKDNFWRLVVASREEHSVSRDHAFLEPIAGGKARLEN